MKLKKKLYDSNKFYGHALSRPLCDDEIQFDCNVYFEDKLNTLDDSDIGFFWSWFRKSW